MASEIPPDVKDKLRLGLKFRIRKSNWMIRTHELPNCKLQWIEADALKHQTWTGSAEDKWSKGPAGNEGCGRKEWQRCYQRTAGPRGEDVLLGFGVNFGEKTPWTSVNNVFRMMWTQTILFLEFFWWKAPSDGIIDPKSCEHRQAPQISLN